MVIAITKIDMALYKRIADILIIDYAKVIHETKTNYQTNSSLGDYYENIECFKDKPDLLKLYKEICIL